MRIARRIWSKTLVLLLAACSGLPWAAPPPSPTCPRVGFIYGLEAADELSWTGVDLPGEVRLQNLQGRCLKESDSVRLEYGFRIQAALVRPAPEPLQMTVPYFIAVLDDRGELVARRDFRGELRIAAGARRGGVREQVEQVLMPPPEAASRFQVLIGLALPREQALARERGGMR